MSCTNPLRRLPLRAACAMLLMPVAAFAGTAIESLKELSVDQLLELEIYSASRRTEPTQGVSAAVYVLSSEDIRRANVTSIPEALRLVPGVQVGQVDASRWAVSVRGFNSREANKLLVLVDGRSVYDQLFSGMLWEAQDLMLEDIERIEVIRGPGGTLWGANAVNGVINIITRNAHDTQGTLATASGGNELKYVVAARHGFRTGEGQALRVYAKAFERDEGYGRDLPPHDASRALRGGFRWDAGGDGTDQVRISGDSFHARTGIREMPFPAPPIPEVQDIGHWGANLLASWSHQFASDNGITLQAYFDRLKYASQTFSQRRRVLDFEIQQDVRPFDRHGLVWGLGLRHVHDNTVVDFFDLVTVEPGTRNDITRSAFLQDSIDLVREKLELTVGVKFEDTDYARAAWQPNVRLAWTPTQAHTLWAAASSAERVPSRLEVDLTYFGTIRPGENLQPEDVRAYEVGYRQFLSQSLWVDVAGFYNDYDDLGAPTPSLDIRNVMSGNTWGGEFTARWNPLPSWRLDATYGYLRMNLKAPPGSLSSPNLPRQYEGLAPRHQATLRSAVDLPRSLELDATVRYVDELPALDYPDYITLDVNLAWRAPRGLEFAIAGRNLLDSPHPEQSFVFAASGIPTEVQRSIFGKVTWQF